MGQNTLEEFSAKFGFTPTPNRWELRLALSVGGGLGGGPVLRGWGSPLPTSFGLGGATKRYYFSVTYELVFERGGLGGTPQQSWGVPPRPLHPAKPKI